MTRVPMLVRLTALSIALVPTAPLDAATLTRDAVVDLYSEAKSLFHQATEKASHDGEAAKALYERAVRRFERIASEGGVRNGKLYYNIGNAYFRMGDVGRAILNYRRARLYAPSDPNLIQNLHYARSRRLDPFETRQEDRILHTLLFWHYDLSKSTRSVLFVVGFAAFWLGATVRLFASKALPRWPLVAVGVVGGLLLASLVTETVAERRRVPGVVLASEVVARKGDGGTYEPSFKEPLHAGTEFALLETRQDWRRIRLPDGKECWVPARAIELVR